MKKPIPMAFGLSLLTLLFFSVGWGQTTTFNYTGSMQTYVVPAGVSSIQIECYGAEGYGTGGLGGYVTADFTVTPGETLEIYVGGQGTSTTGGFNGGGSVGSGTYGAGGGASDVRQSGSTLNDRIIVAGGGGGTGSNCGVNSAPGGNGGGLVGESGCLYSCSDCQYTGAGGTQSAGGIAGPTGHGNCGGNNDGAFGVGGSNLGSSGTGGGGGYYGGGSGCYEGAGGGSSYTDPAAVNVSHSVGVQNGNGEVVITVLCDGLNTTVSATDICLGESVVLHASSTNGGTISWDNGITDSVAFTPPLGATTYTATSSDGNDCSFQVTVTANALPTVGAGADINLCTTGIDTALYGSGAVTYVWDNGVTNGVSFTPSSGSTTYTVTGTDANGCEATDMVTITVGGPVLTAVLTHENVGADGMIDLSVSGGTGSYTYSWSSGPFTQDISNLTAGTYSVIVDDSECTSDSTFTILNVAGLSSENLPELQVYPNPTADDIVIQHPGSFKYEITTISGKIVLSGIGQDNESISVQHLASGIYLIHVDVDGTTRTIKLSKE